ncbi:MAG TPA: hypothetical protein VFS50_06580, partial [Meiothermus sp.]|nr:hypothetical protein [Meiothermus sp.]
HPGGPLRAWAGFLRRRRVRGQRFLRTVEPYVVGWFTPGFSNDAELELYARAENPSGNFNHKRPGVGADQQPQKS